MSKTPKPWEKYRGLAMLVRAECRNCVNATGECIMTGRPCDILTPEQAHVRWRSPPGWLEPTETSGDGECSWFTRALLPVLPAHILDEYEQRTAEEKDDEPTGRLRGSRRPDDRRRGRQNPQGGTPDGDEVV